MKIPRKRPGAPGYISYILVLTTGIMLTLLTLYAYRRATTAQAVQASVQLRMDYSEKEDAVLRSIVAIAPNRAMRAMQNSSASAGSNRDSLRWQNIFAEAMVQANASTSVSAEMKTAIGKASAITGNTGDGSLVTTNRMFTNVHGGENSVYVTPGINRDLGNGYPPALTSAVSTVTTNDFVYPIISNDKEYGSYASGKVGLPVATYKKFNLVRYPNINFGYANPGDMFVAKRNWWAFSLDMADHDNDLTSAALSRRQMVFSIYEVPSQLAISAASFMALGKHGDAMNSAWQNVTIEGNIFAGKARVESGASLATLASRREVKVGSGATIGGQSFVGSPFTQGLREQYEVSNGGRFPVSLPSEAGRAAFIPISRGADFFDRYSDNNNAAETNTLSNTTWNNYSSGAMQCAMRLDVSKAVSSTNPQPTELRFQYMKNNVRQTLTVPSTPGFTTTLLGGYMKICDENQSYTFTEAVDVAYGSPGGWAYKNNVSGTIPFNNSTFGDPLVGTFKGGYWRPRVPFATVSGPAGKVCIAIYPERFPKFLSDLTADGVAINNSISVNADYRTSGSNVPRPSFPSTQTDYGLIMTECANLSAFTKGFSVVTNFLLYIGSDFNTSTTTKPTNYSLSTPYYPPCSLFAPEKRFGFDATPYSVGITGQIGSLAPDTLDEDKAIRPLDTFGANNERFEAGRTTINLRPIKDPADLPPISMMNWLIVLEERRKEFW